MPGCSPCPCVSSKTGAYIVAVLEIICYSFLIGMEILGRELIAKLKKGHQIPSISNARDAQEKLKMFENLVNRSTFGIPNAVFHVFGLVISILLSVGVYKASRKMMKPWMMMEEIILGLKIGTVLFHYKSSDLTIMMVLISLSIYFLFVVGTYYYKLKTAETTLSNLPTADDMEISHLQTQSQSQNQNENQGQNQVQVPAQASNISELSPPSFRSSQEKPNTNLPGVGSSLFQSQCQSIFSSLK